MSLMDKLKKNSKTKNSNVLAESQYFTSRDNVPTGLPALNIALSGDLTGGVRPGLITLAGPSKHGKTTLALIMAGAYMKQYKDAIMLFYDSEFGMPVNYFKEYGIDTDRVFHTPIKNVEDLKFDLMSQVENIDRGEKVIIVIDSIGNLASKKEVEDAINEKSVADMSRAKSLKSLFRMVTPYLTQNDITMVAINHTYDSMGLFPTKVVSGGTGIMYSSNDVFIMGRQQKKEGTDVVGWNFVINVEKSRTVKEKSKIILETTYDGGFLKYGGMLDMAIEHGIIQKPSQGWYVLVDTKTGEYVGQKMRLKDFTDEVWEKVVTNEDFRRFVRNRYMLTNSEDDKVGEENALEHEKDGREAE